MSYIFTSEAIEKLKDSLDIVDVVSQVVTLKRAGANYKGLCPFHADKNPSMVVSGSKQIFTCFSCGAKGDLISFVQRYYHLDFGEAVDRLATQYGISLDRAQGKESSDKYYDLNRLAAKLFYYNMTHGKNRGYMYMRSRGISDSTITAFGIGYADEKWESLKEFCLRDTYSSDDEKISKKLTKEVKSSNDGNYKTSNDSIKERENLLLELGLISKSKNRTFDKFRDRVIFPIINAGGKVIGFGGRTLDPDGIPKYLNSPESKVFQKKNNLYGINLAKAEIENEGYAIVVEGYMDVISLFQMGIKNAVASLGTALTPNQAKLLKKYTKNVVLTYDSDEAGRNAALRGIDVLAKEGLSVKVLHVTDGKDPDEYIRKHGKEEFLKLIKNSSLPATAYRLKNIERSFDIKTDEGKISYIKKAVEVLDTLSPVEAEIYSKRLAEQLGISKLRIDDELSLMKKKDLKNDDIRHQRNDEEETEVLTRLEKTLIGLMMADESNIRTIAENRDILESKFGGYLLDCCIKELSSGGAVDINSIRDRLTGPEHELLSDIIKEVAISGDGRKELEECILNHRIRKLREEENFIIEQLKKADGIAYDSDMKDSLDSLTVRLVEIQKELKSHR